MLLLEGLSSNFYAITRDSVIITAPKDRVLMGTTMLALEAICQRFGIAFQHTGCTLSMLMSECTAAFISSSFLLIYFPNHEALHAELCQSSSFMMSRRGGFFFP